METPSPIFFKKKCSTRSISSIEFESDPADIATYVSYITPVRKQPTTPKSRYTSPSIPRSPMHEKTFRDRKENRKSGILFRVFLCIFRRFCFQINSLFTNSFLTLFVLFQFVTFFTWIILYLIFFHVSSQKIRFISTNSVVDGVKDIFKMPMETLLFDGSVHKSNYSKDNVITAFEWVNKSDVISGVFEKNENDLFWGLIEDSNGDIWMWDGLNSNEVIKNSIVLSLNPFLINESTTNTQIMKLHERNDSILFPTRVNNEEITLSYPFVDLHRNKDLTLTMGNSKTSSINFLFSGKKICKKLKQLLHVPASSVLYEKTTKIVIASSSSSANTENDFVLHSNNNNISSVITQNSLLREQNKLSTIYNHPNDEIMLSSLSVLHCEGETTCFSSQIIPGIGLLLIHSNEISIGALDIIVITTFQTNILFQTLFYFLLINVIILALTGFIFFVIVHLMFTCVMSPMNVFIKNFEHVEILDIENINFDSSFFIKNCFFQLKEFKQLRETFERMIDALITYKMYLPDFIIEEKLHEKKESPTCVSYDSDGSSTAGDISTSEKEEFNVVSHTFLYVRIYSLQNEQQSEEEYAEYHGNICDVVFNAIHNHRGNIFEFDLDYIIADFKIKNHALFAARTAMQINENTSCEKNIAIGICSSSDKFFVAGSEFKKKKLICIGSSKKLARILAELAHDFFGVKVMANELFCFCLPQVKEVYRVKNIDFVKTKGFNNNNNEIQKVYEVVDRVIKKDDEWMYELERIERIERFCSFNKSMNDLKVGRIDTIEKEIKLLKKEKSECKSDSFEKLLEIFERSRGGKFKFKDFFEKNIIEEGSLMTLIDRKFSKQK